MTRIFVISATAWLKMAASSALAWAPPVNLTRLGADADAGNGFFVVDSASRVHVLVTRPAIQPVRDAGLG